MRIKTPKITGPKIIKGARFSLREAAADDPIYTRGFTIGGYYSKDSFPAIAETALPTPNVPSQAPGALRSGAGGGGSGLSGIAAPQKS